MNCHDEHAAHSHGDSQDHSHDHSHEHSHEVEDANGDSLFRYIDTSKIRCLNALEESHQTHPFKNADQKRSKDKYLDSNEDDPEMIIYIP